jgi:hypothetical protein
MNRGTPNALLHPFRSEASLPNHPSPDPIGNSLPCRPAASKRKGWPKLAPLASIVLAWLLWPVPLVMIGGACRQKSPTPPRSAGKSSEDAPAASSARASAKGQAALGKPIIASSARELYHRPACRWANRISPDHLVGYDSAADAVADGRQACSSCCGETSPDAAVDHICQRIAVLESATAWRAPDGLSFADRRDQVSKWCQAKGGMLTFRRVCLELTEPGVWELTAPLTLEVPNTIAAGQGLSGTSRSETIIPRFKLAGDQWQPANLSAKELMSGELMENLADGGLTALLVYRHLD